MYKPLVKLPREVAEAIETLREMDFTVTNWDIVYAFAVSKSDEYPALIEYASKEFDTFLQALVNGYEIELTPEDKVRLNFEAIMSELADLHFHPQVEYWKGAREGVLSTLKNLNIKIEGVNS